MAGGLHVGDVHGGDMRGKGEGACVATETTTAVTQFYWNAFLCMSGYHADTLITIKAEAIRKADS